MELLIKVGILFNSIKMKFKKDELVTIISDNYNGIVLECISRSSWKAIRHFLFCEAQILLDEVSKNSIGTFWQVIKRFRNRENLYMVKVELGPLAEYEKHTSFINASKDRDTKFSVGLTNPYASFFMYLRMTFKESELDYEVTKRRDLKIQGII